MYQFEKNIDFHVLGRETKHKRKDSSIDQFFFPAKCSMEDECRKHIDRMLSSMDERELAIMEAAAEGIVKSRKVEAR